MGVAVADKVDGPYKDLGIILKSGMWDQPSEDGTIYDARVHPNVVDPDTFYDAEGKLTPGVSCQDPDATRRSAMVGGGAGGREKSVTSDVRLTRGRRVESRPGRAASRCCARSFPVGRARRSRPSLRAAAAPS